MNRISQYLILTAAVSLLSAACTRGEQPAVKTNSDPGEGRVAVELFTRTKAFRTPVTRAAAIEDEIEKTPWVLVFLGGGNDAVFAEAARAFTLTGYDKTYVHLKPQAGTCKMLIIGNLGDALYLWMDEYLDDQGNQLGSGYYLATPEMLNINLADKTLAEACELLFTAQLDSPQQGVPFVGELLPLSYLHTMQGIDSGTTVENDDNEPIEMVSMTAKIIVDHRPEEAAADYPSFEFGGIVYVGDTPVHSYAHNLDASTPPAGLALTDYEPLGGDSFVAQAVEKEPDWLSTEESPVYVYESNADNATYIIITGVYRETPEDDPVEYYYKLAMIGEEGILDIRRGHQYRFTISGVAGPGYISLEDARAAAPSNGNLDYEITVTDASSFEIVANNDYYLAVSNSLLIVFDEGEGRTGDDSGFIYTAFTLTTDCVRQFAEARTITPRNDFSPVQLSLVDDFGGILPTGASLELPVVDPDNDPGPAAYDVRVFIPATMADFGETPTTDKVVLTLGNIEKTVYIRRRDPVGASGGFINLKPYGWDSVMFYDRFNSGQVVDEFGSNASGWIRLRPLDGSGNPVYRSVTDRLTVEDGRMAIDVAPNDTGAKRMGTVFLTTRGGGFDLLTQTSIRIRVVIAQMDI